MSPPRRSGHTLKLPRPLLDDIRNGHCLPVIGAGFSRNATLPARLQMPLWEDIGRTLAAKGRFTYYNPVSAVSQFCSTFSRAKLAEELRGVLHIDAAKPGPAHAAFARMAFDTVITTNFDFLLEKAYESQAKLCNAVTEEKQLPVRTLPSETRLMKIHGDLRNPDGMTITEEDYDSFQERFPLFCTYVASLMITKTPLFIGYSLQDQDFRHIWHIVKSRLGRMCRDAYTLAASTSSGDIDLYGRYGVKVVNLCSSRTQLGATLKELFTELAPNRGTRP